LLTDVSFFMFGFMKSKVSISKKENIKLEATALFKKKGYAATSMRDLANTIGVEAATLYSHISSKAEILEKICFDMAWEFFNAVDNIEKEQLTESERLKKLIEAHVGVVTKHTDSSAVFLHEWRHLEEPHLSVFLKMRQDYENKFRKVIAAGTVNGEFMKIDEKLAVLTILSALNHIHEWYKPEGKMTPGQIAAYLSDMLLQGIALKK
jgi:AcrR family transcriptional regulator